MSKYYADIYKLIKKFKHNSIFFVLLKYTIVLVIIPLLILLAFVMHSSYNRLYSDFESTAKQISTTSLNSINNIIDDVAVRNEIVNSSSCLSLLRYNTASMEMYTVSKHVSGFDKVVSFFKTNNPAISNIILYSKYNNYVFSLKGSGTLDTYYDTQWYDYVNKSSYAFETKYKDKTFINVCSYINPRSKYAGLLVIQLDKDYIVDLLASSSQENVSTAFYFTSSLDGKVISDLTSGDAKPIGKKNIVIEKETENSTLSFKTVASVYPENYFTMSILPMSLLLVLLSISMAFLISYVISLKFYSTIRDILLVLNSSEEEIPNVTRAEIEFINKRILDSVSYKQLEVNFAPNFLALRKSQALVLQSQINPHFLFNTLNLVNAMIYEEAGHETKSMQVITLLSELFTELIDTTSYITSVESEIEYAKKYLDIELIKCCNRFDVDWNISPEVMPLYTVKMILQPIIENAVLHGIKALPDDKRGKLSIEAYLENDCLTFTIGDNGKGFNPAKLEEIQNKMKLDFVPERSSIGIINVHGRIKLIFGDGFGLKIYSSENGSKIIIRLPKIDRLDSGKS